MVPPIMQYNGGKYVVSVISLLSFVVNRRPVHSFVTKQRKSYKVGTEYKNFLHTSSRCSDLKFAHDDSFALVHHDNDDSVFTMKEHPVTSLLVHWRGEDVEGYTLQFRHKEFSSAVAAVLGNDDDNDITIHFENALNYTGTELTSPLKINGYNLAMQYLILPERISLSTCIQAAKRCSLIHALYHIVAETDTRDTSSGTDSYDHLATIADQNNAFSDMQLGQMNANQTWCVRVRMYGSNNGNDDDDDDDVVSSNRERRYGERTRSLTLERRALIALTPILSKLGGKVNLDKPECKIYIFDGLLPRSIEHVVPSYGGDAISLATKVVLARRITSGARRKVSSIHPTSRICVTNTPLCPLASFIMANIARIQASDDGFAVLDPYCGSGGTLLAAAMILQMSINDRQSIVLKPQKLVGIEICHDGIVNRDEIRRDFLTRNWADPVTLLHGDSTQVEVRRIARDAIGCRPFDAIISDPPYGIRESNKGATQPIHDLLQMIMDDRYAGTPLLRVGGRLVVFIPHRVEEETIDDIFPNDEQLSAAGLICEYFKEQPLNDMLSRWLISYVCVR